MTYNKYLTLFSFKWRDIKKVFTPSVNEWCNKVFVMLFNVSRKLVVSYCFLLE